MLSKNFAILVRTFSKLALGELGRTTGGLQTVLLALLHTRIAGHEASLLQGFTQFRVRLAQSAADTMTDRASLARKATAANVHQHIEAAAHVGENEGLTNGHLQGFQTEIIINIALVDHNLAIAGHETYAGNRRLAAANGVEIISHDHLLLPLS